VVGLSMLDRKLFRDLWTAKGLLLAIGAIMGVGINNFVTLQSAHHNLSRAKVEYYQQCRMADFWIDVKKVPLAELDAVRRLPGVLEITPRVQFKAVVDLPGFDEPVNALVISMPDRRQTVLNDIVLRQGDYFPDRQDNEVIVSEKFARAHRLHPGQTVRILLNNRRQELAIVGTALSSEYTYALGPGTIVPDPERFGVLYVKRSFAESAFNMQGAANQICGRLEAGAGTAGDETLRRAETLLEPFGVFQATPLRLQASNQFLSNEINGLGAIATLSPSVFLTMAALVLNVLLTRLVRQQRTVLGTLKALGHTDGTLVVHVLKLGIGVATVAGLTGCLCGHLLSSMVTTLYRQFFDFPELGGRVFWPIHGLGLLAAYACAVAGSLQGAWQVLRLQPAEAMRPEPPQRGGSVWLERLRFVWDRLSSDWRLVLRSLLRNRFRTATGLFAAAMGTGILVHSFMLVASQKFMIDFQFYRVTRSDIDVMLEAERGDELLSDARHLPGVDYVEPFLEVACTFEHGHARRKGSITGLVADARLTTPRDRSGERIIVPEAGLVISRRLADILQAETGDRLRVTPVKGQRRTIELPVARIADSYLGLTAYAHSDYLSRQLDEGPLISGLQLQVDPSEERRRELFRDIKRMPAVQAIQARREMIENLIESLLKSQQIMIVLSITFAGVAFCGSMINASLVNLAERQREVATLLALGYTPWRIGALLLRENLITSGVGTALGLPFGYWIAWLTALAYDGDLVRLPVVGPWWVWTATIALAITFTFAAHGVVQRQILKLDFVQALNVKE